MLSKFGKDMRIIQALDDEPNDVGGLTAMELKAKFDEGVEALQQYVNHTLTAELDGFMARRDNPHAVTKAQVGLGSCDDTADADKPVSTAQQAALDRKTDRTESAVRQAQIDAQQAALAAHVARADNPHGVTKAQVGLGSCDNTADADKPVSTAQQAALDLKTDKIVSTAQQAQIDRKAERAAVLEKDNAEPYTPTADHHPATKRYVDEVAGNAVMGQVPDGSISTAKLAQGAVTREKLAEGAVTPISIGAATVMTLTCTVPVNWTADGGFYYQQVSVPGMLETDNPIADYLPVNDNAANTLYMEAWSKVQRIDTLDGAVNIWCVAAPGVAFMVQFKIVR